MNREITYERDMQNSYMKIGAGEDEGLDERILLRRKFPGMLPMEKCYVNGGGQYWYNISGKQALDSYCKINGVDYRFFEVLFLKLCNLLDTLEWNLIHPGCLVLDPELIFVNHNGEEISFVLYPNGTKEVGEEFQCFMEYLLTKLDHQDGQGVRRVYEIYQMILTGGYTISDIKKVILSPCEAQEEVLEPIPVEAPPEREVDMFAEMEKKIEGIFQRLKGILSLQRECKEEIPMVVYPEEEIEEPQGTIHPTVCLTSQLELSQGVLRYEGRDSYPDFQLEKEICILGKSPRVRLYLNRETVSQFHAKFEYLDGEYYIEDMNSTNGTYVNEELLNYKEKRCLISGDVLRFADVKYRFL